MTNYPKEIPEAETQPDQERQIPPEYIPEPKKHETIPKPEKEEDPNNPQS